MKRIIFTLLIILFFNFSTVHSQPAPDSTRSMDSTTVASIKNALNSDPFLMELKQNLNLTEGEENILENMEGEKTETFDFFFIQS